MAGAVLVVHDDSSFLSELQRATAPYGISIDTAPDPTAASNLLETHEYCGLVIDAVLANGESVDFVQRIADRHARVPVVLVTEKVPAYVRQMLDAEQIKLVFRSPADARLLSSVVLGLCGIAA